MKNSLLKEISVQKGDPCISIILSVRLKSFDDRERIDLKLKNAVNKVRKMLELEYEEDRSKKIVRIVKSLAEQVNLSHPHKGVGIFVSQDYSKLIYFPLQVKDKIIVGTSFEIRDVIANLNSLSPYYVLLLSKGKSRMLKGAGAVLLEVNNGHFPCELKEEFQLQQAYPGAPNPEESKINQSRLENYFRQINHSLEGFLKENPLVLLGVQKYLSTYKDICRFSPVIIGEVTGNFDKHSPHEIAKLVWPVVEVWHKKKENMKLDMVKDAVYKNKAVSGIQEVWDVVRLGTGNELIVERDYACKAYLRNPHHNLVLAREPWETLVEIPDAIEAVIDELMEQHDTEIHFVDNGVLKDYGRIVLTTKY